MKSTVRLILRSVQRPRSWVSLLTLFYDTVWTGPMTTSARRLSAAHPAALKTLLFVWMCESASLCQWRMSLNRKRLWKHKSRKSFNQTTAVWKRRETKEIRRRILSMMSWTKTGQRKIRQREELGVFWSCCQWQLEDALSWVRAPLRYLRVDNGKGREHTQTQAAGLSNAPQRF